MSSRACFHQRSCSSSEASPSRPHSAKPTSTACLSPRSLAWRGHGPTPCCWRLCVCHASRVCGSGQLYPSSTFHNAGLICVSQSNVAAPTLCFTLIRVRILSFFLFFLTNSKTTIAYPPNPSTQSSLWALPHREFPSLPCSPFLTPLSIYSSPSPSPQTSAANPRPSRPRKTSSPCTPWTLLWTGPLGSLSPSPSRPSRSCSSG